MAQLPKESDLFQLWVFLQYIVQSVDSHQSPYKDTNRATIVLHLATKYLLLRHCYDGDSCSGIWNSLVIYYTICLGLFHLNLRGWGRGPGYSEFVGGFGGGGGGGGVVKKNEFRIRFGWGFLGIHKCSWEWGGSWLFRFGGRSGRAEFPPVPTPPPPPPPPPPNTHTHTF